MGVDINAYRSTVGLFNGRYENCNFADMKYCPFTETKYYSKSKWLRYQRFLLSTRSVRKSRSSINNIIGASIIISMMLLMSGDIHRNPGPNVMHKDISICHINVRSINATDRLCHIKCDIAPYFDIVTVSETWLSLKHDTNNYILPGFQTPFRRDRIVGAIGYGGVLAWVSDKISCKRRADLENPEIESMWLEVRSNNNKFYLCVIYRAESNTDETFWDILQTQVELCKLEAKPRILIAGDLNADFLTYHGDKLKQFAFINEMDILIEEPTRVTQQSSTVLDQFVSNMAQCIHNVRVLAPFSYNDHSTVALDLVFRIAKQQSYKRLMWDYKNTDFALFRSELENTDFNDIFALDDVDKVCETWTNRLLEIAKRTILNKFVRIRTNDKPWYSNELRKLRRKKDHVHSQAKKHNTDASWSKFRFLRNEYYRKIKDAQEIFESQKYDKLCDESNTNSRKWWSLIKQVYKSNETYQSIPPLEDDGETVTESSRKATLFNLFFSKASTIDDHDRHTPDLGRIFQDDNNLEEIDITEQDVADQIKGLDTSKAYGPDLVPPKILKEGGDIIVNHLTKLFKLTLRKMTIPKLWKQANVIPIYKKDKRTIVNNYRPISLLSVVSKVMERVIFKYVYNHLHDNFILSTYQSGFLPGRSTVTQLIEVYHSFCKSIDRNKEVRVIFLDISKAFDRVWHKGLLYKLQKCGISGNILGWFSNYLSNRQQRVVIEGQFSEFIEINAGVPQRLCPWSTVIFIIHK